MSGVTRKLAAILAADIVGFARLTRLDEDRTLALLRVLRDNLIDPTVAAHHGRIVKRTGDGAIVEFRSVVEALFCAIVLLEGVAKRNAGLPPNQHIEFRIGIHLGDVVEESDGDLMGDGINIAARLEGAARPGCICLSEDAYRQVRTRLPRPAVELGRLHLKNIPEPLRAYSLDMNTAPVGSLHRQQSRVPMAAGALLGVLMVIAASWLLIHLTVTHSPGAPDRTGVPVVAILPFVNASADHQFDKLVRRVSEKTREAAESAPIWRVLKVSAQPVTSDPLEPAPPSADYVITADVEVSVEALRVTLKLDEVRTARRLWSAAISPILSRVNTAAAESEVTGRATRLLIDTVLEAESARMLGMAGTESTTWACVLQGYAARSKPELVGNARSCLDSAAQREPDNANVWSALAGVVEQQRIWGWGLPLEQAVVEKRSFLAESELAAALRARDLAPFDPRAEYYVAMGYYSTCQADRVQVEALKAAELNPYDPLILGDSGLWLAYTGHWDEGAKLAARAIQLAGPSAQASWWQAAANKHWLRGEYAQAYDAFQHSYVESSWLSQLQLAYALPPLDRLEDAKAHVKQLLRISPNMSLREADAFAKLICLDPAFRKRMADTLRLAGVPE